MEKIICAAVRFNNKVWMGHRHLYALEAQRDELSFFMNRQEMDAAQTMRDQGFVTSEGRYVSREEAWEIASNAGQIIDRPYQTPGTLYSEDLY